MSLHARFETKQGQDLNRHPITLWLAFNHNTWPLSLPTPFLVTNLLLQFVWVETAMQGNVLQQFEVEGHSEGLTEFVLRVAFFVVCIAYQGSVVDLLIELARLRLGMTLACPLLRGVFLIGSLLLPLLFSFHLTEFVIFLSTQHKGRGFSIFS